MRHYAHACTHARLIFAITCIRNTCILISQYWSFLILISASLLSTISSELDNGKIKKKYIYLILISYSFLSFHYRNFLRRDLIDLQSVQLQSCKRQLFDKTVFERVKVKLLMDVRLYMYMFRTYDDFKIKFGKWRISQWIEMFNF